LILGGNISFDKSQNGYYKWSIQGRNDIENFKAYILKYPSFSNKKQRLFLTDKYFELKDLRAYSASPESVLGKAWIKFNDKWNNRG
jgi:ubiquinol-cytochrome c reductase cytochrome b subunit